jgi:hypothetical protein
LLGVVVLWIHILAVFATTIHPMADDAPAQQSISSSLLFLVPQVAVALYFLHVLGKHKAVFQRPAAT